MSERKTKQLSLADALVYRRARASSSLERIAQQVSWDEVEKLVSPLRSHRGAPGYSPLMMTKALLLQQWYALSDPQLEEALADRLSFRAFVGVPLDQPLPDHSTLWRFREALSKAGLATAVFAAITAQFEARGLILKRGTLIDASLVAAQAVVPPLTKESGSPAGGEPGERPASKLVRSTVDPDAGWTRRKGWRFFGYKVHLAVDQGSHLVRAAVLTSAGVNDTAVGDQLIQGDEGAVYADKAYDSHARAAALKQRGIRNRIMKRGNKHHALSKRHGQRNALIGRIRGRVETIFAIMKRHYRFDRVRYFNHRRNEGQLMLMCAAINLRRALVLTT
jgi:IS5 family transposase